MNELLELAIAAHGGMDRFRQLRTLRVAFSAGGLLFAAKGNEGPCMTSRASSICPDPERPSSPTRARHDGASLRPSACGSRPAEASWSASAAIHAPRSLAYGNASGGTI